MDNRQSTIDNRQSTIDNRQSEGCTRNMSEPVVVFMTAANGEEAARLADLLVGSRLAACVQILPGIESVYRWKGVIQRESEVLLLAKSTLDRFDELEREVRAIHSYETPEIVALPASGISQPYRKWLDENLTR